MIAYSNHKKPTGELEFILKAHNQMGGYEELMSLVNELVDWMDAKNDEFAEDDFDSHRLSLFTEGTDNESIYAKYVEFFKWVPELDEFFVLGNMEITYVINFSDDEITEIRQYVAENHEQIPFHAQSFNTPQK